MKHLFGHALGGNVAKTVPVKSQYGDFLVQIPELPLAVRQCSKVVCNIEIVLNDTGKQFYSSGSFFFLSRPSFRRP